MNTKLISLSVTLYLFGIIALNVRALDLTVECVAELALIGLVLTPLKQRVLCRLGDPSLLSISLPYVSAVVTGLQPQTLELAVHTGLWVWILLVVIVSLAQDEKEGPLHWGDTFLQHTQLGVILCQITTFSMMGLLGGLVLREKVSPYEGETCFWALCLGTGCIGLWVLKGSPDLHPGGGEKPSTHKMAEFRGTEMDRRRAVTHLFVDNSGSMWKPYWEAFVQDSKSRLPLEDTLFYLWGAHNRSSNKHQAKYFGVPLREAPDKLEYTSATWTFLFREWLERLPTKMENPDASPVHIVMYTDGKIDDPVDFTRCLKKTKKEGRLWSVASVTIIVPNNTSPEVRDALQRTWQSVTVSEEWVIPLATHQQDYKSQVDPNAYSLLQDSPFVLGDLQSGHTDLYGLMSVDPRRLKETSRELRNTLVALAPSFNGLSTEIPLVAALGPIFGSPGPHGVNLMKLVRESDPELVRSLLPAVVLGLIVEGTLGQVKVSPEEASREGSPVSVAHMLLHKVFQRTPSAYMDPLSALKGDSSTSTATQDAIERIIEMALKDTSAMEELRRELPHEDVYLFGVPRELFEEVKEALRTPWTWPSLIQKLGAEGRLVRQVPKGDLLVGIPVLGKDSSPEQCREALTMLWSEAGMSETNGMPLLLCLSYILTSGMELPIALIRMCERAMLCEIQKDDGSVSHWVLSVVTDRLCSRECPPEKLHPQVFAGHGPAETILAMARARNRVALVLGERVIRHLELIAAVWRQKAAASSWLERNSTAREFQKTCKLDPRGTHDTLRSGQIVRMAPWEDVKRESYYGGDYTMALVVNVDGSDLFICYFGCRDGQTSSSSFRVVKAGRVEEILTAPIPGFDFPESPDMTILRSDTSSASLEFRKSVLSVVLHHPVIQEILRVAPVYAEKDPETGEIFPPETGGRLEHTHRWYIQNQGDFEASVKFSAPPVTLLQHAMNALGFSDIVARAVDADKLQMGKISKETIVNAIKEGRLEFATPASTEVLGYHGLLMVTTQIDNGVLNAAVTSLRVALESLPSPRQNVACEEQTSECVVCFEELGPEGLTKCHHAVCVACVTGMQERAVRSLEARDPVSRRAVSCPACQKVFSGTDQRLEEAFKGEGDTAKLCECGSVFCPRMDCSGTVQQVCDSCSAPPDQGPMGVTALGTCCPWCGDGPYEHNGGCLMMTCPRPDCGGHFCYECGERFTDDQYHERGGDLQNCEDH